MYQALYRKWRPRTFDDVVGQSHITETLKRQVSTGRLSHAYLFTGTRGTGKTSCAKILARAVNCEHPVNGNPCNECDACRGIENGSILDVLELDAASNNGVDQVRALRDEAVYTPAAVRKRVYIVDEVHMLSTAAFNALLKILEEPPEHLMFILATTELHKVPATIKSRCQQFSFQRILPGDIAQRLAYVAGEEQISLTGEGAELLARLADGGLRDALSLLDQCAVPGGPIGEAQVLDALGLAGNLETAKLMGHIALRDAESALEDVARLYGGGKDVSAILGELSSLARDLLIRKTAPRSGTALLNGGFDESTMRGLSEQFDAPRLAWLLAVLQATLSELPRSSNRRTDAELCMIRLCDERLDDSVRGMNARLERVEAQLLGGIPLVHAPLQVETPVKKSAPEDDLKPLQDAKEMPQAPVEERLEPGGAPSGAPANVSAVDSGALWNTLVAGLKDRVGRNAYTFLSKPDMVRGSYEDGVLTLWADDELIKGVIGKSAVLEPVAALAGARLGGTVRVQVKVGKPETQGSAGGEHDKLDDLLAFGQQFDTITVKE